MRAKASSPVGKVSVWYPAVPKVSLRISRILSSSSTTYITKSFLEVLISILNFQFWPLNFYFKISRGGGMRFILVRKVFRRYFYFGDNSTGFIIIRLCLLSRSHSLCGSRGSCLRGFFWRLRQFDGG